MNDTKRKSLAFDRWGSIVVSEFLSFNFLSVVLSLHEEDGSVEDNYRRTRATKNDFRTDCDNVLIIKCLNRWIFMYTHLQW